MNKLFNRSLSGGLCLVATAMLGCRCDDGILGVDKCADVPCGAIPATPGSHLCQWQQAQVASASIDLGVFYQAEFIGTSDTLGPAGCEHVARMVQQGAVGRIPIIIDPSDDPQRDQSRVVALAAAFTAAGAPMSLDQIEISYPPAIGLDGFRAQQAARQASQVGGQGGGGQGGGGFGGGGFGGGGLGGGGGGFGGGGFF
jgi:uncharacterized membrane protein YgcG